METNVINTISILRNEYKKSEKDFMFKCYSLAGNGNANKRIELMEFITGKKTPKSKAGINNLMDELKKYFKS